MKEKATMCGIQVVLLAILLCTQVKAEVITPNDLCKLYVGSQVFNLTGLKNHEDLNITKVQKGKSEDISKYTILSSLCTGLSLGDIKQRYPVEKREQIKYTPTSKGTGPNIVVIKENPKNNSIEAFDLASFDQSDNKNWKASCDDLNNDSKELQSKGNPSLDITYNIVGNEKSAEVGLKTVSFKFVCFQEEDFDFFDERVVGSTLVLQYNGKKACSINKAVLIDSKWNFAIVILICTSMYGLFLDRDNERMVMTLGGVQGAFMTAMGVYLALRMIAGPLNSDADTLFQLFGAAFMFLAIGLSYFSRYVSLTFVSVASSFSINVTLLYAFCLIFQVRIPLLMFYIGGVICWISLLALNYYNTTFREKYSFTIVSATTNSFYLCSSLAYASGWFVDMFTFNQFKPFGKVDSIQFKHWVFFLLQLTITGLVTTFRVHQAYKAKMEAITKNAGLFRKQGLQGDIDGYIEPDRGDDYGTTVIAM